MWLNADSPKVEITDDLSSALTFEYRGGSFAENGYLYKAGLKNNYALSKAASANLNYSWFRLQSSSRGWYTEHRPDVEFHYNLTPAEALVVKLRSRAELRTFSGADIDTSVRLRQRILFSYREFETVHPYISEEIFYSTNGDGFNQNRAFAGVQLPELPLQPALAFGVVSKDSSSDWSHTGLLFIDINF